MEVSDCDRTTQIFPNTLLKSSMIMPVEACPAVQKKKGPDRNSGPVSLL
jgi:hypothetical protein